MAIALRTFVLFLTTLTVMFAGPVGVDGMLGPEWNSVTPVQISNGPDNTLDFLNPAPQTSGADYSIYLRGDQNYLYALLLASIPTPALFFSNLYFDLDPSAMNGSDVGVEVRNSRFFVPGGNGVYYDASPAEMTSASDLSSTGIELAIPWQFFQTDPLGMGFPKLPDSRVVLQMSQSFGYAVVGGPTFGPDRLGAVSLDASAPEPSTFAGGAIALLAAVSSIWRGRTLRGAAPR